MKKTAFFILALGALVSCKKEDQKLVNNLSGNWIGVKAQTTTNGQTENYTFNSDEIGLLTFNACNTPSENCSGSATAFSEIGTFTYTVNNDATKITFNFSDTDFEMHDLLTETVALDAQLDQDELTLTGVFDDQTQKVFYKRQ